MAKGTAFAATTFVLLFTVAIAFEFDLSSFIPEYLNSKSKSKSSGCEKQLQKQPLDWCHFFLRDGSKIPQLPPSESLLTVVDQASSWRDAFLKCCDELEDVGKKCRCDAINQVYQQQMQIAHLLAVEMHEMLLNAQSLPLLCRFKKAHPCKITSPVPAPMATADSGSSS